MTKVFDVATQCVFFLASLLAYVAAGPTDATFWMLGAIFFRLMEMSDCQPKSEPQE